MTWQYIQDRALAKIAIQEIKDYLEKNPKAKLALDTEGYNPNGGFPNVYLDKKGNRQGIITLIQIGADPRIYDKQWVFDVRYLGETFIGLSLKSILENTTLLGQNLKFDYAFLVAVFNIWPNKMRDTMLISQIINAGRGMAHSLSNLYRQYFNYGWFKSETGFTFDEYEEHKKAMQISDWSGELTEGQLEYARDDVRLIFFLYEKMLEELDKFVSLHKKKGVYDVIKLECDLIPEYTLMEMRGLDFDIAYHKTVISYLTIKSEEAYKEVGKYFTHKVKKSNGRRGKAREEWYEEEPINIRSPKQVMEALTAAGLKPETTAEDELKRIRVELDPSGETYQAITALIRARKAESLLSKFGQKYIDLVHADGRIHPSIHQMGSMLSGVATGRSSSSDPNIQQIPARDFLFNEVKSGDLFRKSFACKKGYKLIVLDYSQIEPRCTAQVTKDPVLTKEFQKEDVDLHAKTAQILMGLAEPPHKGSYEREYIGKTANLSMFYFIGANKLAKFMYDETIDNSMPVRWTVPQSREALKNFYSNYSGIKETMNQTRHRVEMSLEEFSTLSYFKNKRPLYTEFTLMGRPRRWYLTDFQERLAKEGSYKLSKHYTETVQERDFDGNIITRITSEWSKTIGKIAGESYNFKIQGSCADILKLAVLRIGERFRELGLKTFNEGIIAVIHDEIVARVKEEDAEFLEKEMRRIMIESAQHFIKTVPVKVGGGIGDNWASSKSEAKPGLKNQEAAV